MAAALGMLFRLDGDRPPKSRRQPLLGAFNLGVAAGGQVLEKAKL